MRGGGEDVLALDAGMEAIYAGALVGYKTAWVAGIRSSTPSPRISPPGATAAWTRCCAPRCGAWTATRHPTRRGSGRNPFAQAIAHELGGDARLELPPEGAAYELRVPVTRPTAAP